MRGLIRPVYPLKTAGNSVLPCKNGPETEKMDDLRLDLGAFRREFDLQTVKFPPDFSDIEG